MTDIIIRHNARDARSRVTPTSEKGMDWFRRNVVCDRTSMYLMVDQDEANDFAMKLLAEGINVITR